MTLMAKYHFNKYIDFIIVVYLCLILLSYEHTSCVLLDPMSDTGRPNMKLFIKAIYSENYWTLLLCVFSGDRIT